jgi:hypothetical protein
MNNRAIRTTPSSNDDPPPALPTTLAAF